MSSSDADSPNIHIYNARKDAGPVHTLDKMHTKPVHIITYNPIYDCVISVDTGGMLEYWEPSGDYQKPTVVFNFKSETDLYEFKKVNPPLEILPRYSKRRRNQSLRPSQSPETGTNSQLSPSRTDKSESSHSEPENASGNTTNPSRQ